jgi:hypothetical protein
LREVKALYPADLNHRRYSNISLTGIAKRIRLIELSLPPYQPIDYQPTTPDPP